MLVKVDLDGALVDLHTPWLALYNKEYGDSLSPQDITAYEMDRFVKPECERKIYDYLDTPGIFMDAEPMPGAVDGVRQIVEEGHHVLVVTRALGKTAAHEKFGWVKEYLPFLTDSDVIFTKGKHFVKGDCLIDDCPENVRLENLSGGVGILFTRPWNLGISGLRIDRWDSVHKMLVNVSRWVNAKKLSYTAI